jgi:ribosome assembly protein YihI (activator of Der GTPase)
LNGIQAAANGSHHPGYEPYVPQQPKGSFISNALRRLSSGSQVGTSSGKTVPNGGVCPRRVLNIDPNRSRCLVPELDQNKLRRVAFCVDVEIASGPKYKDDIDDEERKQKRKDKKLKERGEGEALKHPESVAETKEKEGAVNVCSAQEVVGTELAPNPEGTVLEGQKQEPSKKKEKKKRSEAERKERKEKKRRKAEENGSIHSNSPEMTTTTMLVPTDPRIRLTDQHRSIKIDPPRTLCVYTVDAVNCGRHPF